MPELKLYGTAASRAWRTIWLLGELGIPYDHIPITFRDGANRAPAYRAINPTGQMPTIDDAGFILRESLAINLYLAKKHATGTLYPADSHVEALALQWSFFAATQVEFPIRAWPEGTPLPSPADFKHDVHDSNPLAVATRSLHRLNTTFAATPYLLGDTFTIADFNVACVMQRLIGRDFATATNLEAWLKRCYARPANQAAIAQRHAAMA